MAFGGNSGGGNSQLAVACMGNPLAASVAYDANNNLELRNAAGSRIGGGSLDNGPGGRIHYLYILILEAQATPALAAWQGPEVDGSTNDCGILTTAALAANLTSLPANFGPGRGNWTASDWLRTNVTIVEQTYADVSPADAIGVVPHDYGLSGGDLQIVFKNYSQQALSNFALILEYKHSIGVA